VNITCMDRPIRPEPSERPRIKRAMRAAHFMKWGATPVSGICLLGSVIVGATTAWYVGLVVFIITHATLFILGYILARCPRCGQVWWSGMGAIFMTGGFLAVTESAEQEDETESFVCRRCRLDIGLGLRE
jgi:hypothetical protein